MDIGSIFLILAVLVAVVLFIIRPILEHSSPLVESSGQNLSSLLAERDHVISSIQELDEDYKLGKIPGDDYPTQRQTLLQNGADLLRKIDEFQSPHERSGVEDRLEAAIIAHRQNMEVGQITPRKNGNAVPPVPDDDLEQRIASRRRSMQGKAGAFCPKCGRPVQNTDHFCPRCGATLT